jgi:hypothetical protein
MSNRKTFRSAQDQVPVNPSHGVRSGFVDTSAISISLKKTQTRRSDPYKTIVKISERLRIPTKALFYKILRTDTAGNAYLHVMQSSGSSNTTAKNEYIILVNLLSETIKRLTLIRKPSNKQKSSEKSAPQKDRRPKRSTRRSYRSRKTNRRTRRSRTYRRYRKPQRDQIVVKSADTAEMAQPTNFNTPQESMPKKDFANIFESANTSLYTDEPDEVIEIEAPPGVAKYVSLGIEVDRPSILSSTELNRIVYDDSLVVFDQMVLERELRLQLIYDNLEPLDEYEIEKLLETQTTIESLTNNAIDSVAKIAKVDEQIINDISISIFDLATTLGFKNNELLTRIYLQTAFDLGAVSEFGPFYSDNAERTLTSQNNSINIDLNRHYSFYTKDFINKGISYNKSTTDTANYNTGKLGNLLAFQSTVNPPEFEGARWDSGRTTLGSAWSYEDTAVLMQTIYTELLLSKLYTEEDANVVGLKGKGTINLANMFLGDLSDAAVDLNSVNVTTGLASITKYNSGGVNYYPLEAEISSASGINGRTFLDAVVQPAVGSLIEDEDPDFALLDAWIENSRATLSSFFKYSDVAYDQGGASIILNEVILTLVNFLSDRNKKIGSKKHPFSNSMSRKDSSLNAEQLTGFLNVMLRYAGSYGYSSILYNTFGYKTHPYFYSAAYYSKRQTSDIDGTLSAATQSALNAGEDFSPAENDDAIKIANNFLEEGSRFFNLLENNIMTSIDLLLADAGLVSATALPEYDTASSGFFVDKSVSGKETNAATNASPKSPHEFTAFSGVPKIMIRRALANICWNIFKEMFGTRSSFIALDTLLDDDNKALVMLSKVAVENLDAELGPVRYKVTHGQWPPETGDFEDLTDDVLEKFVPSSVRDALENGQVEVEVDSDGSVEIDNPLDGWEFLESKEDFCPITLILDGEDNSTDNVSFVRANRSLADSIMQQIVTLRTKCFKMRNLLEAPMLAFENFPTTIEDVASTLSFDSIRELSQLPSIDGQELVKFISPAQISSAKKSLMLETPSPSLRYLPNKYAISKTEYNTAKSVIEKYVETYFERPEKAIIHSVGIPAGYLSAESLAGDVFSLTRNASYMFFPTFNFEPKENRYHADIFLIPGSFTNCDPEASFQSNILNSRFYIAAEGLYKFVDYSDALEFLDSEDGEIILQNHVVDYALYLSLKITTGIEFSEDTFRLNKLANERYLNSDSAKEIPNLIKKFPEAYEDIIKEDKVSDFRDAVKVFGDLTIPEINRFMGALDCRLLSPEMIAKQALSPRLFDRVFNILTHPNDHYIDEPASNSQTHSLEHSSFTINGKSVSGYRIALKDGSTNQIRNDHFAEYNFMVEK